MPFRKLILGSCAAMALFGPFNRAFATSVLPTNLERLVQISEHVVFATILSSEIERAGKGTHAAVVTRVRVEETYKGTAASELTFRQLAFVPEVPRFFLGEKVVLFLPKASALGFASPVALEQGVFRIKTAGTSAEDSLVSNGAQNRFLELGLKSNSAKDAFSRLRVTSLNHGGALNLRHLKQLIGACPKTAP